MIAPPPSESEPPPPPPQPKFRLTVNIVKSPSGAQRLSALEALGKHRYSISTSGPSTSAAPADNNPLPEPAADPPTGTKESLRDELSLTTCLMRSFDVNTRDVRKRSERTALACMAMAAATTKPERKRKFLEALRMFDARFLRLVHARHEEEVEKRAEDLDAMILGQVNGESISDSGVPASGSMDDGMIPFEAN